jgi:hypothetical protein
MMHLNTQVERLGLGPQKSDTNFNLTVNGISTAFLKSAACK